MYLNMPMNKLEIIRLLFCFFLANHSFDNGNCLHKTDNSQL